jgi:hypothetical protein
VKIKARGISRFHFWGTYSQSFSLHFDSAAEAELALPVLQQLKLTECGTNACGDRFRRPDSWRLLLNPGETSSNWLGVFASGSDAERVVAQLVSLGADEKKINSLQFSCDRGEEFFVSFEIEDPAQAHLDL